MFDFDVDILQKKSDRDYCYDMNQVIKNVYRFYTYIDGIIGPSEVGMIKSPELFSNSVFVNNPKYDFLNKCMIDPSAVSSALKRKPKSINQEGIHRTIINDKDEKFEYGVLMDEFQLEDARKFVGAKTLADVNKSDYPYTYSMDTETKQDLLEYRVPEIILGTLEDGKLLRLLPALKLFPCIKKADTITIAAKKSINNLPNVFDIMIISRAERWSFYSFHKIINIEA